MLCFGLVIHFEAVDRETEFLDLCLQLSDDFVFLFEGGFKSKDLFTHRHCGLLFLYVDLLEVLFKALHLFVEILFVALSFLTDLYHLFVELFNLFLQGSVLLY